MTPQISNERCGGMTYYRLVDVMRIAQERGLSPSGVQNWRLNEGRERVDRIRATNPDCLYSRRPGGMYAVREILDLYAADISPGFEVIIGEMIDGDHMNVD